jgi:protein-S-isoprenylcysteine O-methyltransferase Ste14
METSNTMSQPPNKVHKILAHSYFVHLLFLVMGLSLDSLYPLTIFSHTAIRSCGFILLALATVLILWAQATNRTLDTTPLTVKTFMEGPYKYSRTPTHWGLLLLVIGYGIISNSVFIVLSTLIAFVVTKSIFVKQQEDALTMKYGAPYLEYQKLVKL